MRRHTTMVHVEPTASMRKSPASVATSPADAVRMGRVQAAQGAAWFGQLGLSGFRRLPHGLVWWADDVELHGSPQSQWDAGY